MLYVIMICYAVTQMCSLPSGYVDQAFHTSQESCEQMADLLNRDYQSVRGKDQPKDYMVAYCYDRRVMRPTANSRGVNRKLVTEVTTIDIAPVADKLVRDCKASYDAELCPSVMNGISEERIVCAVKLINNMPQSTYDRSGYSLDTVISAALISPRCRS